jgi:type IV pilus modification protein PilV
MKDIKHHLIASRHMRDEQGFSLIEVIVALVVLTIGVLAVNAMQTVSIRGNKTASDITKATNWSADQVERIFRMDYDDLADTNENGNAGLDNTGALPAVDAVVANDPNGDFTIVYNVAEEYPLDNIKTVHVIVTWADRGTNKSVTIRHKKSKFM